MFREQALGLVFMNIHVLVTDTLQAAGDTSRL